MSHFTVLSGFLDGAATTDSGVKNEIKLQQRVSKDSERFIIIKFRSTPVTVLDATIVEMFTASVVRRINSNLSY
ncbi:MAG: hypothetical protein AAFS12_11045, partial [Cyanobacteria bacterium J06632_19]